MRALMLTAGFGTRLRPFTFHRAKAALPLLNIPFIRYPLQCLVSKRIQEVIINLHAHPQSVRTAAGDEYAGVPIRYSHEPQILGTAGAIAKARPFLADEPFLVMNGDMLCDPPVDQMLEQHQRTEALVTVLIMRGERFAHYSGLHFDPSEIPRLLPLEQKGEKFHYTGVQIVSPEIFTYIPEERKTEVFTDIYPQFTASGKIRGYVYDQLWMEVGNLNEYLNTALDLLEHPLPEHLRPQGMQQTNISHTAEIESGASVTNSIVMDGATVKSRVQVDHSIIGWDVDVTKEANHVALARGILPWYLRSIK